VDTVVFSALISAIVSLIVALISFYTNRRSMRQERELLELQLQRKFTEKLYDKRLDAYPLAFEITDLLSGEHIFSLQMNIQELLTIRERLLEWRRKHGFIMSDEAISAFYELRDSLSLNPDETLSNKKRKSIFRAKNKFRRALRNDVNLLYFEEREGLPNQEQNDG